VLETIARWDLAAFEPKGKTGLRPGADQRSRFCSRRDVARAFAEVLEAARFRHILVSYNNEGLLPEDELKALLTAKAAGGKVEFHTLPYKRFRADSDGEGRQYKGDEVREFLFYVAPRSAG
jgi:adenine-specific DNA-methyltransferase